MALHRLIDWATSTLLGWVKVRSLEEIQGAIRMWDITVEPNHEFLVKAGSSWLRTHNCIIDDPHSESEALQAQFNPGIYDRVYEWYTTGPRQRLQPGGAIIIVQTRWSMRDLTGQILEHATREAGAQWEVFEFPAILPNDTPLWPEFWPLEELQAIKAELPVSKWNAQYQQNPTSDESAIIKRQDWRTWTDPDPPENIEYVLMAWDTAFEKHSLADYSAMTCWGVFTRSAGGSAAHPDQNQDQDQDQNIILLDAWRGKLEFPELKAQVLSLYKEHNPDSIIIEKKGSGAPLIYELRKMGVPVQEYTPSRGSISNPNNKIQRLHSIADIFASGRVWAPATRWAEEVVEEVASFPSGRYDDYVDTTSLAINRARQGGLIGTRHDKNWDEDYSALAARRADYY